MSHRWLVFAVSRLYRCRTRTPTLRSGRGREAATSGTSGNREDTAHPRDPENLDFGSKKCTHVSSQ